MKYDQAKATEICEQALREIGPQLDKVDQRLAVVGYKLVIDTTENGQFSWSISKLVLKKSN